MTASALRDSLERELGLRPGPLTPVRGGDICASYAFALPDGQRCFVKHYPAAPAGLFETEAEGLRWLGEAGAIQLPRVLSVQPTWLLLEWLQAAPPAPDHDVQLGRGLAELHRASPGIFGWHRNNFIGPLPQENAPTARWPEFYGERRLRPMVRRARDAGSLPASLAHRLDALVDRLAHRVGPEEAPARLHGDLWGGNAHRNAEGNPCLVDPAVYGGHREVDLAMMQLFGGFSTRCLSAYAEAYPLAHASDERVPLYQLYPLLVHVNLFGSAYLSQLQSALSRCE